MRISSFDHEPIAKIPFLNAGKGAGSFYVDELPIHLGQFSGLPDDLEALIATADLQGREQFEDADGGPPRLLGEVLPARLVNKLLPELNLDPERVGVLLAGDFFSVPNLDQRGGSGDVTEVWQAFAKTFRWVGGVAGNHDLFREATAPAHSIAANAHYLDGDRTHIESLTIAGIGGIIGNPRKPHRKTDDDFVKQISQLTSPPPDVLVMHDGPDDPAHRQRGSSIIRQTLEHQKPTLIIRGHAHWNLPLTELANGTQVLNVDCRVAILRRG